MGLNSESVTTIKFNVVSQHVNCFILLCTWSPNWVEHSLSLLHNPVKEYVSSFSVGGDLVSVKLHCPNGSPITADIEDNDNGTYTASFTPVSKGDHQITVHVRGKPIQGSSFDLQVGHFLFLHGPLPRE